jgi:FAE1/Type III polyketide synthase-like protein
VTKKLHKRSKCLQLIDDLVLVIASDNKKLSISFPLPIIKRSTKGDTTYRYFANRKSMLVPNCLFRVSDAAILLSNHQSDHCHAKYRLFHVIRTHQGADNSAFWCVFLEQDEEGEQASPCQEDLMAIAGHALKANITTLGPVVLPLSERVLFFTTLIVKKVFNAKTKPYIPDFKLAFNHFCIHAGGRAVTDELEKNLQLEPEHVEASRMTLHRFGKKLRGDKKSGICPTCQYRNLCDQIHFIIEIFSDPATIIL